jgi:hypothetical protein
MQTPDSYLRSKPALRWVVFAFATLGLWTLAGAISLYQVAFDIRMTAYPYADVNEWRHRLYIRIATTILIGICWSATAIWLYRNRRSKELAPE